MNLNILSDFFHDIPKHTVLYAVLKTSLYFIIYKYIILYMYILKY